MRIVHVAPAYYPATRYGGPIRSIHGLTAALVRRGHEVHVLTTNVDGTAKLDVPLGRIVDVDGVQVRYFDVPGLRRLCWAPQLRETIRTEAARFDVLHLQSIFLWPTYAAARAAERAGVPYVVSPRGMLVGDLIRRRSQWAKRAWLGLIEQRSLHRAAAIHSTSELETAEAAALYPDLPPITCIPNGIAAPEVVPPLASGPFAHVPRPYALFLSRISWKKGIDRLLRAWPQVPALHLVIAGNDDEGLTPQLLQIAAEAGVQHRVSFIGAVSDEHKWPLFREAQMFVLPSHSENFANVVAEAMAMSCPVVLTPEVGLAMLVEARGAGIVTPGDPQTLAFAINRLQADPELRREMGAAGRRAVDRELSWDSLAERFEALYLQACAEHRYFQMRLRATQPLRRATTTIDFHSPKQRPAPKNWNREKPNSASS